MVWQWLASGEGMPRVPQLAAWTATWHVPAPKVELLRILGGDVMRGLWREPVEELVVFGDVGCPADWGSGQGEGWGEG